MGKGGALGTVAIVLALAAPASAATTWTVDPTQGTCGGADVACATIQQAHDAAANGDVISLVAGSHAGATITKQNLRITGQGSGVARVTSTLAFSGDTGLTLERLAILPASGAALAVSSAAADASKSIEVLSSILSGSGSSPAISVISGLVAGPISITGRRVTIADAGAAPATTVSQNGGDAIAVAFNNSLVKGATASGTAFANTDTTSPNAGLFVAPASEDFHLLPDPANPAINSGGSLEAQEAGVADVDGDPRPATAPDKGADEFVDHDPVGSGGPAGSGGAGGSGGTGGGPGGGASGPDLAAPTLSIISPRAGQRLKRGKRAPVLRGRTADATGVRAVELALRRFEGRRCRWYDGRRAFLLGSCTRPRYFRALIDDFAWSYTFPRKIVPGVGRYELRARATDFLGNRTTAFSASSRTLARFRIVR
jgi:hypothetical protein